MMQAILVGFRNFVCFLSELLVYLGEIECWCCMQGNIVSCDDKFALVLGCRQVNDIIGKDIVQFIPSITICDSSATGPQVCFL